ncbi:anthrax toxin lethal factor-related metalloendopeptidase [Pseudoflavonifractor phocaeensis]|uniref:anthrax toxin lethal factor-related metalloendopeptidase n=1 Tax=Pseudoflavonifractor phocaeensis TaxID=1870988 RepID=UPI00399CDAD3|nr:hypothetical protein [Pseudoflavonifractor phocaeensis]
MICGGLLVFLLAVSFFSQRYSLNNIKSKTVDDGQHGTARWATPKEIRSTYHVVPFRPRSWRKGIDQLYPADATASEIVTRGEAQNSGLRDYAKTNSREYFADCFVYWITYSGNEKRLETFRNAAPETYAYMGELSANNWS